MATTGVIAPVIGEIRKGRDIEGCKHPSHRYIWLPCSKCGNPRWVQLIKNKPRKLLCLECAGLNRRKVRTINNAPPYIGEIRKGWEIEGCKQPSHSFIWQACPQCGKLKWMILRNGKPRNLLCLRCLPVTQRKVSSNKGVPYIGEIRMGWEINRKSFDQSCVWQACAKCGVTRWVPLAKGQPLWLLCKKCAGIERRKIISNKGIPQIGEIRMGRDIEGCKHPRSSYIWLACQKCGKARWLPCGDKDKNRLCNVCAAKQLWDEDYRKKMSGENHPNWQGGISFEPYTLEFTDNLKEQIRQRDNYTCQLCGKPQGKKKLAIHHINYIKKDCRPKNLVSLCSGVKSEKCCHTLTNNNRAAWMAFFTEIMNKRFPSNEIQLIKTLVEGV